MIKYTKTKTVGEMQTSESVEFETFDQLMAYLRKDDAVNAVTMDFSEHPEGFQDVVFNGDSHKQKDLLDDGDFLG